MGGGTGKGEGEVHLLDFILEVDRATLKGKQCLLEPLDNFTTRVWGERRRKLTDEDDLLDGVEHLHDGVAYLTDFAGRNGQGGCS